MEYVIIGNSAAAIGAVEGIRKVDADNPITIIAAEPYHTYSRPLISYYLAGKVSEDKMYYRPRDYYEKYGVNFRGGVAASGIDVEQKKVILADGTEVSYDKLLIATGGKPFIPPMEGLNKEHIYTFQKWDDVKAIGQVARIGKKAVIIGAGLIGMKAAEALYYAGVDVTVVELANRVLSSILDEKAASIVQDVMEEHGIKFVLNTTVSRILGDKAVTGVLLANGEELECDFLIVAIGVIPNTDPVKNTPVRVNRGILVDEKMATSVPDVYAAGDVTEGRDAILQVDRVIPILPNAYKQGEVAGQNMAGADVNFSGGFAMNAIGFFGFPMTTAGILAAQGPEYEEVIVSHPRDRVYRKLVLKDDHIVGYIALKEINRIGMLTSLISDKITVKPFKDKLMKKDFGYIDWPDELRKERMLAGGSSR
jgi:NAD(P)H-nitrite reductase large subunit